MSCPHLAGAGSPAAQTTAGCQDCREISESDWVHLRLCLACGHVGCCDSSPHQHATAHFQATGHPMIRSFQPGEAWRWCFVDEVIG